MPLGEREIKVEEETTKKSMAADDVDVEFFPSKCRRRCSSNNCVVCCAFAKAYCPERGVRAPCVALLLAAR